MNNILNQILENILSLNRLSKRVIVIIIDIVLCVLCTSIAFTIRLEEFILFSNILVYPIIFSVILVIPIFWLFGLYRIIFRFTSLSLITNILNSILVYALLYFLIIGVYGVPGNSNYYQIVPRSIGIIQPMLLFFAIIASRLGAKYLFSKGYNLSKFSNKKNVLVYGAGEAGRQLVLALENSPEFNVSGFLDDNIKLHKQVLLDKNVYPPHSIKKLLKKKNIFIVFLALPSINRNKRNKIIENLNKYKLSVKTLQAYQR